MAFQAELGGMQYFYNGKNDAKEVYKEKIQVGVSGRAWWYALFFTNGTNEFKLSFRTKLVYKDAVEIPSWRFRQSLVV